MSKNKISFYIVLGAVFVAFSVEALAVPFVKNGAFWVAYLFGVAAIGVQLYTLPMTMGGKSPKSKFYGFPVARISVGYLVIQLILSLIVMALAKWLPVWVPLVVFILLLCAAVIGFVAAETARTEVQKQDTVKKKDTSAMTALRSRSAALVGRAGSDAVRKELEALAESFRYSDPVSSEATAEAEAALTADLEKLSAALDAGEDESIFALCRKLRGNLAARNDLCRQNK